MSCATQSGVVLVSTHVLVGFLRVDLRPWPVGSRKTFLSSRDDWDQGLLTTMHFPHLSQYFTLHAITMSMPGIGLGAGDTKVTQMLCPFPWGYGLHNTSPSITLTLSLGARKGDCRYSHILDEKATGHWSFAPGYSGKGLDSNLRSSDSQSRALWTVPLTLMNFLLLITEVFWIILIPSSTWILPGCLASEQ